MTGGAVRQGPRECSDPAHGHVLMCPVQATAIAATVVMAGMARREDGIGNTWWMLGLSELRYADAEQAVRDLVAGGIGDRSWITVRDVVRRAKAIRHARHELAPDPVPPAGLEDDERLTLKERESRQWDRQKFIRWYWTAVGNGDDPAVALELAAQGIGADRYLPPAPADADGPVDPGMIARARAVVEANRKGPRRG